MSIRKGLATIPGFSGYYVSKNGEVFSDKRGKKIQLKDSRTFSGYRKIALTGDDKEIKYFQVHRLVAQCFLENPNNLPIVNHKNGEKDDNRLSNLEWTDAKGNAKHYQEVLKPMLKPKRSREEILKEHQDFEHQHYKQLCNAMDAMITIYGEDDAVQIIRVYKLLTGRKVW